MIKSTVTQWPIDGPVPPEYQALSWVTMLMRGIRMRCPVCGTAPAFNGFLKVKHECTHCHYSLGIIQCDDAPPYIAMTLGLLLGVVGIVISDQNGHLDFGLALGVFLPLVTIVSIGILRPIKGIILAAIIKNKMQ